MTVLERSPGGTLSGLRCAAWLHYAPLTQRLERGEGLLYPVAVSLALGASSGPRLLAQATLALLTLALLYLVNDLFDCHRDLHDPGKNRAFTAYLVLHRPILVRLVFAEHLFLVAFAFSSLGWRSAAAVAAVTTVNVIYSALLKGTPVLDAPWVALWGGLYLMTVDAAVPVTILAIPAVMTAVMHAYQVLRDRDVDRRNAVETSAVAHRWLPTAQIALASMCIGALIAHHSNPWLGATGLLPLVLHRSLRSNQAAWLGSKAYFAVIWLFLLGEMRGLV